MNVPGCSNFRGIDTDLFKFDSIRNFYPIKRFEQRNELSSYKTDTPCRYENIRSAKNTLHTAVQAHTRTMLEMIELLKIFGYCSFQYNFSFVYSMVSNFVYVCINGFAYSKRFFKKSQQYWRVRKHDLNGSKYNLPNPNIHSHVKPTDPCQLFVWLSLNVI